MHRATTGRCFQAEVLDYGEGLWSEQTCLTWTFQSCGDAEALGVAVEEAADRDWGSVIARDGGPSVCSESKAAWGPARRQSGGDTVTHSPKCSAKGRSNPEQRGGEEGIPQAAPPQRARDSRGDALRLPSWPEAPHRAWGSPPWWAGLLQGQEASQRGSSAT